MNNDELRKNARTNKWQIVHDELWLFYDTLDRPHKVVINLKTKKWREALTTINKLLDLSLGL